MLSLFTRSLPRSINDDRRFMSTKMSRHRQYTENVYIYQWVINLFGSYLQYKRDFKYKINKSED